MRDITAVDSTDRQASTVTAERREITLADGRRLAYAEYGAPTGVPVFVFPGTPGSHLLSSVAEQPALARGVRIIAPDRPGIGRSDDQPGRRFSDWPADVAQLADALGCERFAVVGISGGGPYALSCASALPARVTIAGIVSSPAPFDVPGMLDGMPPPLRAGWALLRRAPGACALALRPAGAAATRFPLRALAMFR
ncbi:MAG: alpha/beta hydrolase, partial [Chloroflexi bacterium]|nr:alpha/beta hydrolase [Chloroflexota bacterium]